MSTMVSGHAKDCVVIIAHDGASADETAWGDDVTVTNDEYLADPDGELAT